MEAFTAAYLSGLTTTLTVKIIQALGARMRENFGQADKQKARRFENGIPGRDEKWWSVIRQSAIVR